VLTEWLAGLQGRFEDYCNRKFARTADVVEDFNGGESLLFLSTFPVETASEVRLDASRQFGDNTKLAAENILLNNARGTVAYGAWPSGGTYGSAPYGVALMPTQGALTKWPEGFQNIRVKYTGGFVADGDTVAAGQTAMPEGLRRAFRMQAGFEWRNRLNLGKTNVNAGKTSAQISAAEFLPEVENGLTLYRRFV